MASRCKSPAGRAKRKVRTLAFPVSFWLRIVKLFQQEGNSARLLVEQFGISTHSVQRWVRAYSGGSVKLDNCFSESLPGPYQAAKD